MLKHMHGDGLACKSGLMTISLGAPDDYGAPSAA